MDNMNRKRMAKVLVISLLLIIAYSTYRFVTRSGYDIELNVSVILRDANDDRWTALKSGMEQAADDGNIKINYINAPKYMTSREEIELLRLETSAGADAIIFEPIDSDAIKEYLSGRNIARSPVVMISSGVDAAGVYATVQANNRLAGNILAKSIIDDYGATIAEKKIGIVTGPPGQSAQMDIIEGFNNIMTENGLENNIEFNLNANKNITESLKEKLRRNPVDILVTLESLETEVGVQAVDELMGEGELYVYDNLSAETGDQKRIAIYGCGYSSENVYNLDLGKIRKLIVNNDFNMGYLAVDMVMKQQQGMNIEERDIYVDTYAVDRSNLFDSQIEKLVFPNVQ